MGKSIPIHIPEELDKIITIVLENTDDFENISALIRICVKKQLKKDYPELLLEKLENEEE